MMWLALTKVAVKSHFGLSLLAYYARRRDRRLWGWLGIAVAVAVGVAPLVYFHWRFLDVAYRFAAPLGQPQVIITLALVAGAGLVFFLSIAHALSVFYLSNDLATLVPLPLRPGEILGSKLAVVVIGQSLIAAPLMLPALVIYGWRTGVGMLYWPGALLVFVLSVVSPVSLAAVAVLLLVRVANLSRHKDLIRFGGMLLLTVGIMAFSMLPARIVPGEELVLVERLLHSEEGLVTTAGRAFPPAVWATRALTGGPQWWLALVTAAAAGVAATVATGQALFYGGLIGGEEVAARRRTGPVGGLPAQTWRQRGPVLAGMRRELHVLVRTPIYLFNSVAMVVLVPCLMAVPLLMGGGEATRGMLQLLGPVNAGAAQLVGIGFIVVMATMAPASSSAFSREGRHFWLSKVIPVEPRLQVRGKLAQAYAVIGFAVVLVSAVGCLWLGWRWAEVFTVALAGLVGSLPPVVLGLAVDLWRPYLSWENPQQAIKQNLNVFLGMVTGGAAVAGLVQLVRALLAWGHGLLPALTGAGTVALVAGGVGYLLLELQAARLYDRVEV